MDSAFLAGGRLCSRHKPLPLRNSLFVRTSRSSGGEAVGFYETESLVDVSIYLSQLA
jgi:hypothetical protein